MRDVIAIVLGGVVTYVTRVVFLIDGRVRPPRRTLRYLPLVGPAVLGAIAVPGLVAPRGEVSFVETVPSLVAAFVAAITWRLTRQLVFGLIGGFAVWWGIVFVLAHLGLRS